MGGSRAAIYADERSARQRHCCQGAASPWRCCGCAHHQSTAPRGHLGDLAPASRVHAAASRTVRRYWHGTCSSWAGGVDGRTRRMKGSAAPA
eukprot:scaffold1219_cov400-Prasinococcus_capsulatus_cf.AAC.19